MYLYQEKDSLLHKVHPLSLIMYVFTISIFAFVFCHPFYLFGLFISVALVVLAADIFEQWLIYLKLSLVLIMMILLINSLFVQVGSTVLFLGSLYTRNRQNKNYLRGYLLWFKYGT